MLKKEEVYVRVSSEKKARKLASLLEMFGFKTPPNFLAISSIQLGLNGFFHVSYDGKKFDDYLPVVGQKQVSLKELRNILAREYLKEGDVVVCGNSDCRYVLVFNGFDGNYIDSNLWYEIDSKNVVNSSFGGHFNNFIRYATEEEKKLLKPMESVIDKAISLLQHGLGLDYSHEVIQGLEKLKNK